MSAMHLVAMHPECCVLIDYSFQGWTEAIGEQKQCMRIQVLVGLRLGR